jgi:bis(5'-adenosyl)-triphosphatase
MLVCVVMTEFYKYSSSPPKIRITFALFSLTMLRIIRRRMTTTSVKFGRFRLQPSQVFFESDLVLGVVNLKPIVPGHVLVIPKRVVERFGDLTSEEVVDLWTSVHKIGPALEKHHGCSALNIAIQDGVASGQSVPHVHVHILPRKEGDFERNDDIYEQLEVQNLDKVLVSTAAAAETLAAEDALPAAKKGEGIGAERLPRSPEEMAAEAASFRLLFPENAPR